MFSTYALPPLHELTSTIAAPRLPPQIRTTTSSVVSSMATSKPMNSSSFLSISIDPKDPSFDNLKAIIELLSQLDRSSLPSSSPLLLSLHYHFNLLLHTRRLQSSRVSAEAEEKRRKLNAMRSEKERLAKELRKVKLLATKERITWKELVAKEVKGRLAQKEELMKVKLERDELLLDRARDEALKSIQELPQAASTPHPSPPYTNAQIWPPQAPHPALKHALDPSRSPEDATFKKPRTSPVDLLPRLPQLIDTSPLATAYGDRRFSSGIPVDPVEADAFFRIWSNDLVENIHGKPHCRLCSLPSNTSYPCDISHVVAREQKIEHIESSHWLQWFLIGKGAPGQIAQSHSFTV